MEKPLLVIDKSFANKKSGALSRWATQYTLVVPSAFYYEVFTTTEKNRRRELKNFPEFRRIHLPTLSKIEMASGEAAISIDARPLSVNPSFADGTRKLLPEESNVINTYKSDWVDPTIQLWWDRLARKEVPGFSNDELATVTASDEQFVSLCRELQNPQRIRKIAKEINWLHAGKISPQWFHYRLLQTWTLQGLILLRRYPHAGDQKSEWRLEHDIHDIEYLSLGLHAGALATAETSTDLSKASMSWRFRLLAPHSTLITE